MFSVRKRLLQAALVFIPLLSLTAQAWDIPARNYGSCQLKSDGLFIPPSCYQLDPSRPNSMPDWFELYGPDSTLWSQTQKRTYLGCHCQSYDQLAAQFAQFGINIDNYRIASRGSGPGGGEVADAINAEMDAAFASVGGTPFFSSPWVYPGPSVVEGYRRNPIVTQTLTEAAPASPTDGGSSTPGGFKPTFGEDGYSHLPTMNVLWNGPSVGELAQGYFQNWQPRLADLNAVDRGEMRPAPSSRLGAYEATRGYPKGTVGYAVHNAIADIYMVFGTLGEEQIGLVFNSQAARSLFHQPVTSIANFQMATLEYEYWRAVNRANPDSFGGRAGSAFTPEERSWLQRNVYSRDIPFLRVVLQAPPPPPPPGS